MDADTYNCCILCKNSLVERNAYLMPCIHSVCEACIKVNNGDTVNSGEGGKSPVSIVNLADDVTCTDCKEKYQIADLVENLLTRRSSDTPIVIEEVEKHACTGCEDAIEATSHCEDCEEWLCDQCVFAHKRVKITKDHTITGKNNKNSSDGTMNETATFCKLHKHEKLNFFCEVCDMLTCRDCQLLEHKEHRYQFLPQAAEIYKEQTEKFAAHLQAKKETLKLSASKIQEKLIYVKSQKDVVRDEVQSQARKLVEHVIEYAKQILQNLNFVCDAAGKRLAQEGADASAMLQKIEHMSSFLRNLKNEKNDLSLLYTKKLILKQAASLSQANLELYSLKGQLNLEYRHESPFFFQNIHKLGTIFVNGLRYPPPKYQQGQQPPIPGVTQNGAANVNPASEDQRRMMAFAMQRAAQAKQQQQQHQQHQFQNRMSVLQSHAQQRPVNQQPNQPNILRNNQQGGNLPFNWQSSNNHRGQQLAHNTQASGGQMVNHAFLLQQQVNRQQHHSNQNQQQFQPMKLNTRPVTSNIATHQQMAMGWGGNRSSGNSPRSTEGGSMGNNRRHSTSPAHNGNVESTEDDFYDCIITAAKIKGQKLEDNAGLIVGDESNTINLIDDVEADNVLSDVLKNMPKELTETKDDIIKQENVPAPEILVTSPKPAPPTPVEEKETTEKPSEAPEAIEKPTETTTAAEPTSIAETNTTTSTTTTTTETPAIAQKSISSESDEKASQESSQSDPNEDYCACCHNGGDVLCCEKCPRVFHLHCHIPPLPCVPPGIFVCLLCEATEKVPEEETDENINPGSKRKAPLGLTDRELKICEKILLELFCHQQSVAFHEPVGRNVLNYHKIVTKPQDFTNIKCKLSRQHFNHYNSVYSFLSDVRQVFINCALYNAPESEVGKSGQFVRKFFEELVEKNLPGYLKFVQSEPTITPPPAVGNGNSSPKRQRIEETTGTKTPV
ncbi:hypothetical protein SNE40_003631 [Patella caerulea]|uniref:E3 ubiquitin-protein ligase TRIM33 n=1 Tax=Patella caerulea TaxID=87958 RepID=A0AAN8KEI2_PATCE